MACRRDSPPRGRGFSLLSRTPCPIVPTGKQRHRNLLELRKDLSESGGNNYVLFQYAPDFVRYFHPPPSYTNYSPMDGNAQAPSRYLLTDSPRMDNRCIKCIVSIGYPIGAIRCTLISKS
jgi:hypothetical protein